MTPPGSRGSPRRSPWRILGILILTLFSAEFLLMLLLPRLFPHATWVHPLVDATLMVGLAFPAMYWLVFLPMCRYIQEREQAESELRHQREHLEETVQERTAELRQSETFNRTIIESSADCIKVVDAEGRLQYMSPGGQQLLKIDDFEKFRGRSYEDFWNQADRDHVQQALAVALKGGTGRFTGFCPTCDGTPKWWDVVVSPLVGPDGKVVRLLVVSRDITERRGAEQVLRRLHEELETRVQERTAFLQQTLDKLQAEIAIRAEAEKALRESEERYRTLFESAPLGIAVTDFTGQLIAVNQSLCQMLGGPAGQAADRVAESFYANPAERGEVLGRLRRGERIADWETQLKREDGTVFPAALHIDGIQVGGRECLRTIVQDLTRRKQAEKHVEGIRALLELFAIKSTRREYLNSVVEVLRSWCECGGLGIRLIDGQGSVTYAAHSGLSEQFIEACLVDSAKDCPCLRVLSGRPLPEDRQFMTPNASLFCSGTSRFAAQFSASTPDRHPFPCLEAGYDNLIHTPIRRRGQLVGSIHMTHREEGKFTRETVAFVESVAPLIGEALHRFGIEEALSESEQRFRSMFETHDAVMLLIDPGAGVIVDANPAAAAWYGYTREQLRSMKPNELRVRLPEIGAVGAPQHNGERDYIESETRLSSGEVRTVEVYSSPLAVQGQRLLFSIVHDITERKLLQKQVLEVAEKERQRVGRDLHDSLGGKLAGAALLTKALFQSLTAKAFPEAALAGEVVQCVNEAIGQTRSIAHGLCPAALEEFGLVSALREYASEVQKVFGISCQVRAVAGMILGENHGASHLLRIVQEAVNNAIRHGHAKQITIRLTEEPGGLALEIQDDGQGLPADFKSAKGMGLRTMKYRADVLGAQFDVKNVPGKGVRVRCLLSHHAN